MPNLIARVLVIAGSDSGAGAGIQADLKTIMALGAYATTAITALTAQNTRGVHGTLQIPAAFIRQQIEVVLADIGADAIKTGMLGDAATIDIVADTLERLAPGIPLIVDPVMLAKGGAALLDPDALAILRARLLPMATLITPNIPEAEALLGHEITDLAEAATALLATGAHAVLLKGGHRGGATVTDVLAEATGITLFERDRIDTQHTHGTGCTLASAIAAGLAQGQTLPDAVARARTYVQSAIQTAPGLGRGHGPLNHATPPPP
ncbi:MAG: bifunctional hydroxymethylpyrimidine kinase/phosphomethylpyrimidine kinase [Acetobacteraceae bacterium]